MQIKKVKHLAKSLFILAWLSHATALVCRGQENYLVPVSTGREPVAPGKFAPGWESLSQYEVPEWFRNAKFGIWAHWGPQCQPGQGDWYARMMYRQGTRQYKWHLENYGHPSKAGFKEVIDSWKADRWDPEKLVQLYKRAGARYFFAMANHHDNLDMWDSKYQEWNSARIGPKKDILAGWAAAAKNNQLPFGLSVHAAHAWSWFETAQQADTSGQFAGVPYDGQLTAADGNGTWWKGLDPAELYAQDHPLSEGYKNINKIHSQWNWGNGAAMPSQEYCEKFYNRTVDMINRFQPDLLYFDDTGLPLYPISDAGLKIAAHFYNSNMAINKGKLEAVLFGKILTEKQKECLVWDVERGAPDKIQQQPWQTCTCIGEWHYSNAVYENNRYKTAKDVIHMLIDVVSKNGNLLLNIPVRGDGGIDEKEIAILEGIAAWMEINKESIFDTRPWKVFGEGPAADSANPINAQGFNEGKIRFSSKDIRFTKKENIIYATLMGAPAEEIVIRNLPGAAGQQVIEKIEMLGSAEKIRWVQHADRLTIQSPVKVPNAIAVVFKIYLKNAVNPIIFADVPDMSMVRVGNTYYMSSTTMHMSPGVPIMKSNDLVNWQLVNYAYDTLANVEALNLANGKNAYGRGSWASCIRYHNGIYYVTTFAQTTGKTHIYTTRDIEKGPWKTIAFSPSLHDHSLFFDDDGKVYMLYGNGKLVLVELKEDLSGLQPGGINQVVIENASAPAGNNIALGAEGTQLYKVNGKYYLFNITWPRGGMRTVVIHRADKITGPYEGRVGLQHLGVAQGGLIDKPDGTWYAYLFRDYGAVGRIPYLVPVKWDDGWPVLGVDGKVPDTLELPPSKGLAPGIVSSDEFDRKPGEAALPLVWQWNHNPDNDLWSVTKRKGYLRLTTGRVDTSFLTARNSLTQRTLGPECTGATRVDVSGLQDGDIAGLGLLQKNYGFIAVKVSGNKKFIVMVNAGTGKAEETVAIPLRQKTVYFKAACDFRDKKDMADFFYSLDGKTWHKTGAPLKMSYTLPHFMGYRFALFNYSTKRPGGSADFDFFHVGDRLVPYSN